MKNASNALGFAMRLIYDWFDSENWIELLLTPAEVEALDERPLSKNFAIFDGRGVLNVTIRKEKTDATNQIRKQESGK